MDICLLSTRWQQRNVYCKYRIDAAVLRYEIACGKLNYFYGGMNDYTDHILIHLQENTIFKIYIFGMSRTSEGKRITRT